MISRILQEKVAIVTGGSRGIGKEICRMLAKKGASVVINYSKSDNEAIKTLELLYQTEKHMCIKADVSNPSSVDQMFDQIIDRYGRLDILVNNAAWTTNIDFEDLEKIDESIINKILNTNIKGVFFCSKRAILAMKNTKAPLDNSWRGNIVNISSTAVQSNIASNMLYIASKAAVNSLTKTFAMTFGNIARINAIAPGLTRTKITNSSGEDRFLTDEMLTPLGRICKPIDIANTVFALITQLTFVNGEIILVDGGRVLSV